MSKKSVLKASALAVAVATAAAPMTAAAEISGSLGITSQYLWRAQQLTTAPTVNGSLDYGHESGLYAGVWTSSETSGATEYDMYVGFGGETESGFSYDISYIDYNYTGGGTAADGFSSEDTDDDDIPDVFDFSGVSKQSERDFKEVHVGVGLAGFAAGAYIGVGEFGHPGTSKEKKAANNDDRYFYLSYTYDKFTVLAGKQDFDGTPNDVKGGTPDYTHIDVSYALTDQFTFTASKIVDQEEFKIIDPFNLAGLGGVEPGALDGDLWDDDVVLSVSYSFAL